MNAKQPLSATDRRIVAAAVAETCTARALGRQLTADERAAIDRAARQIAGIKPGHSRAPATLETVYAVSDALAPIIGRITRA